MKFVLCLVFIFLSPAAFAKALPLDKWDTFGNVQYNGSSVILANNNSGSQAGMECRIPVNDEYIRAYTLTGIFDADAADTGDMWLYCDIYYRDGTHTWGPYTPIERHGRSRCSLDIVPTRPVEYLYLLIIFRNSSGTVIVKNAALTPTSAEFAFSAEKRDNICSIIGQTDLPARVTLRTASQEYISDGVSHNFEFASDTYSLYVNGRQVSVFTPAKRLNVWAESSPARIFPNTSVKPKTEIDLSACRGGRVSFQLCLRSDTECRIKPDISPLYGDNAEINDISLRCCRYIKLENPSDNIIMDGEHRIAAEVPLEGTIPGLWGDILIPADTILLHKGRTEAFWVTIQVPKNIPKGLYKGQIKAADTAVSVSLRVHNIVLPDCPLKTSFSFVEKWAKKAMGEYFSPEKAKAFLRNYGIGYEDIGYTGTDSAAREHTEPAFVVTNIAEPAGDEYTLYNSPEDYDKAFEDRFADRIRRIYPGLLERHLLQKAYIYGFDERGSEYYNAMKNLFGLVHRQFPGIKTLSTADLPKDICPADLGIDAYAALDGRYSYEQKERQKSAGGEYWWYVCGNRRLAVENSLLSDRLLFWQTKLLDCDGFLYWALNFWSNENNNSVKCNDDEIVFDIFAGGCHGDGRLIYPGEKGELYASPRMEMIGEGLEDYTLLCMYEKKYGRNFELLTELTRGIRSMTRNKDKFERVREILLKKLESE